MQLFLMDNWTKPRPPTLGDVFPGIWEVKCCYPETWPVSSPVPSLPQFQRPHRLRCFTQPMKCLKDTESVSGHGFLSAGLPGWSQLSISVPCMHSSSSAWTYTYWWPGSAHVQSTKMASLHSRSHTSDSPEASMLSYIALARSHL